MSATSTTAPTYGTTISAPAGQPVIEITRAFAAPVSAVFAAHVERDLYAEWLSCGDPSIELETFDARPGGTYRYSCPGLDGSPSGYRGVFHTVRPNEAIISTFEYEAFPDQVGVSVTTLTEQDGQTHLHVREVYPSQEARDGAVAHGMESGIHRMYDRLAELVTTGATGNAS